MKSINKSCLAFVCLFVFLSALTAGSIFAAEDLLRFVKVVGEARIQGGNITSARNKAIQDGIRQAMAQGVGMMMDATSIVEDDDLMEKIYAHTQGAVTGYDLIKTEQTADGIYRVWLKVGIKTGRLKNGLEALGLLAAMMDNPRIMILPESGAPSGEFTKTVQDRLVHCFADKRFEVVDPKTSAGIQAKYQDLKPGSSDNDVVSRFGLDNDAEIVVLFSAQAGPSSFDGIMESVPVDIRARAVSTTTGQVFGANRYHAVGLGQAADTARKDGVQRAADRVAADLVGAVSGWWREYTANGIPYIVTLKARPGFEKQLVAFQDALLGIPGVVSVSERASLADITELVVKYRFGMTMLKKEIFSGLSQKAGFEHMKTIESKGRFLVLAVGP